jgi:hypothetical protein
MFWPHQGWRSVSKRQLEKGFDQYLRWFLRTQNCWGCSYCGWYSLKLVRGYSVGCIVVVVVCGVVVVVVAAAAVVVVAIEMKALTKKHWCQTSPTKQRVRPKRHWLKDRRPFLTAATCGIGPLSGRYGPSSRRLVFLRLPGKPPVGVRFCVRFCVRIGGKEYGEPSVISLVEPVQGRVRWKLRPCRGPPHPSMHRYR